MLFRHGYESEDTIAPMHHVRVLCLWGTGVNRLYAAGEAGEIYIFNGEQWKEISYDHSSIWGKRPIGQRKLLSIWGEGRNSVFIVGQGGIILHIHKDKVISFQKAGPFEVILSGSGKRENHSAMLVGSQGGLYKYEDTHWKLRIEGRLNSISAVWSGGPNAIYAVTNEMSEVVEDDEEFGWGTIQLQRMGRIYSHQEDHWKLSGQAMKGGLEAVCGYDAEHIYTAGFSDPGQDRLNFLYLNEGKWKNILVSHSVESVTAIWCGPMRTIFLSLSDGTLIRYQKGIHEITGSFPESYIQSIWGLSLKSVFAVGYDQKGGKILKYDGDKWIPTAPIQLSFPQLNSLDVNMQGMVVVVGDKGTLLYFNGESWNKIYPVVSTNLQFIKFFSENEFVVAGEDGSIFNCVLSE